MSYGKQPKTKKRTCWCSVVEMILDFFGNGDRPRAISRSISIIFDHLLVRGL